MPFADREKKNEYSNTFNKAKYDRLAITVKKGKREVIADFAKSRGMSLNEFVNKAIDEKMEREI